MNKEKNKFTLVILSIVKENIMNNKEILYNPVFISGLSYNDRYNLYFNFFDKDFISNHKVQVIDCKEIDDLELKTKSLIIIENIDLLKGDLINQEKVIDLINKCLKEKVQIIIGSNLDKNEIELDPKLHCRLGWGISLDLYK